MRLHAHSRGRPAIDLCPKQACAHETTGALQLKRATTYPADYVDTFVTRFPDIQVRAGCQEQAARACMTQVHWFAKCWADPA